MVIRFLLVLYDVIMVPLAVSDVPRTDVHSIALVVSVIWMLDILVSFLTGFCTEGLVEMRLVVLARRYWRTWFSLDLAVLLARWTGSWSPFFSASQALLHVFRARGVVRLIRVVRVYPATFDLESAHPIKTRADPVLHVLMMVLTVVINHCVACGWILIGFVLERSYEQNCVDEARDKGDLYLYLTSLHWSLTQFTPAAMDVHATKTGERIYSICVITFAFMTFSSFVSSIPALLQNLQRMRLERDVQEKAQGAPQLLHEERRLRGLVATDFPIPHSPSLFLADSR